MMKWKLYSGVLLLIIVSTLPNVLSAQYVNVNPPLFSDIIEMVEKEAEINGRDMAGIVIESEMNFFDIASVEVLKNGISEWVLDIESSSAMGLCVYFDDFHIPVGGSLFFESDSEVFSTLYQEGPVMSDENNDHGRWASSDIPGDVIRIIYRQPSSSIGTARLGIMGIGYLVGGVSRGSGSEDCEVDIMCPEGDSWQCERDAVVRLRITQDGVIFYCSGSMVNNTEYDCRQLLLSAFHCADSVEEDEWAYLKVRYNYEYNECGGTVSINSHARTGVIPLTNSNDASFNQSFNGSDFLLMEVEDVIPETWNPYYAGFDASGETGHIGVGIHHPAGDRKKISNYTNPLTSSNIYAVGSHWKVYWTATETNHGVTEGGSSGSPIFSENHYIVGTLSSGSSACVNGGGQGPYQPDFYGKMSYHWDGPNPIPSSQRLNNFLDPSGSGQTIVNGSYVGEGEQPCANFGACNATEAEGIVLENKGWSLSPNPASGIVDISMPVGAPLAELRIYDARGRMLESLMPNSLSESLSFDVSHLSKGLHFFTVRTSDGTSSTLKLVIE